MNKLFKILMTAILVLFLVGCFAPTEDDIYGVWEIKEMNLSVVLLDSLISNKITIDNEFDDYFSANFYQLTEESLIQWSNFPEDGTFKSDTAFLTVAEDTMLVGGLEEKMAYSFNGKNELTLTISEDYPDDSLLMSFELGLHRYKGEFPPANWTAPLHDDIYEPDEENYTVLKTGKVQKHTITQEDVDYFTFTPRENRNYLFQVNSNSDLEIRIESARGIVLAEDDDNDMKIENLEGPVECALKWTSTSTADVTVIVKGYWRTDIGYYTIEASDEGEASVESYKKSLPQDAPIYETPKKNNELKKYIKEIRRKYLK
ncbi:MAG: hypothetical protein WCT23_04250 [Candidatus Neomarinimicrobiota bacterium]|jgi:hypothetical protein